MAPHEKGGVEGEVGRFRRRHLTPVPHVGSLAALNEALAAADARDDARRIDRRSLTVGQMFALEQAVLNPLPHNEFDASTVLECRVDAKARICVRQSYYSVPARLVGRRLAVRLGARDVVAVADGVVVAAHTRSLHKGSEDLLLDHYLEILARKPGALAGSTALATARANGAFTAAHQRFWDSARRALGDAAGTRALVGVLLLHRTLPAAAITAGMDAATSAGFFDADVVAVQARHSLEPTRPITTPVPAALSGLASDVTSGALLRPVPALTGYDDLLTARAEQEVPA
jgi:hypothetical protein